MHTRGRPQERARGAFGGSGKRSRRIGMVALARRLLIALWRYLEFGEIPAGRN
ncbi:MAG: hypothetical protein ACREV1_15090 [Gammaproteobacteria bacterium]